MEGEITKSVADAATEGSKKANIMKRAVGGLYKGSKAVVKGTGKLAWKGAKAAGRKTVEFLKPNISKPTVPPVLKAGRSASIIKKVAPMGVVIGAGMAAAGKVQKAGRELNEEIKTTAKSMHGGQANRLHRMEIESIRNKRKTDIVKNQVQKAK